MTLSAEVVLSADRCSIQVKGVLNFYTVPSLRTAGNTLAAELSQPIFDFQEVIRTDSAALSLLTAWARAAKKTGKSVKFINLSPQLMDIARLSNLDKILQLAPQP